MKAIIHCYCPQGRVCREVGKAEAVGGHGRHLVVFVGRASPQILSAFMMGRRAPSIKEALRWVGEAHWGCRQRSGGRWWMGHGQR
jgi:hypothetical protein